MTSAEIASRLVLATLDCRLVSFICTLNSCGYIQVKSTEFISQEGSGSGKREEKRKNNINSYNLSNFFSVFFRRYYG